MDIQKHFIRIFVFLKFFLFYGSANSRILRMFFPSPGGVALSKDCKNGREIHVGLIDVVGIDGYRIHSYTKWKQPSNLVYGSISMNVSLVPDVDGRHHRTPYMAMYVWHITPAKTTANWLF